MLAEDLGDRQHEIGRRGPLWHRPGETEPHHPRNQHRAGLAEHGRLGFDPTHAPSDDAKAIHHGRVRVSPHQRVGVRHRHAVDRLREDHAREVLDVHLVHDAGVRRNHLEVIERALAPPQKRVSFPIARKLQLGVQRKRVRPAEVVHLDRVVDHELDRLQRIDAIGVAAKLDHRIAHRRQIDDAWHTGEILQQHARRHERDFFLDVRRRVPLRQRADVVGLDEGTVLASQQVLEQDLHRVRKPRDSGKAGLFKRGQAVNRHRLASDANFCARTKAIESRHDLR